MFWLLNTLQRDLAYNEQGTKESDGDIHLSEVNIAQDILANQFGWFWAVVACAPTSICLRQR